MVRSPWGPEAERVLHPVRLHGETINHQQSSRKEERERAGRRDRRDGGRRQRMNKMRREEEETCPCLASSYLNGRVSMKM